MPQYLSNVFNKKQPCLIGGVRESAPQYNRMRQENQQQDAMGQQERLLSPQQVSSLMRVCEYPSHIVFVQCREQPLDFSTYLPLTHHEPNAVQQPGLQQARGTVQEYHFELPTRIRDFECICVQLFYVLFACFQKMLMVAFHEHLLVYCRESGRFLIVVEKIAQLGGGCALEANTKNYFHLYIKLLRKITGLLEQKNRQIQYFRRQMDDADGELKCGIAMSRLRLPQPNSQTNEVLLNLQQLLGESELAERVSEACSQCFSRLQASGLISTKSILNRIKGLLATRLLFNNTSTEIRAKILKALRLEKKLRNICLDIRTHFGNRAKELQEIKSRLLSNFESAVADLQADNFVVKCLSHEDQSSSGERKRFFKVRLISSCSSTVQFKPALGEAPEKQVIECTVKYEMGNSSMQCRVHTGLIIQDHNADLLLQLWGSLTTETLHAGLEIGERVEAMQKKRKYLIVKARMECLEGDSLITKFFGLLDISVSTYKCMEDELREQLEYKLSAYRPGQLGQIYSRINHYAFIAGQLNHILFTSS